MTEQMSSGGVYVEGAPQRSPHNQPQTSPGLPPDMADYRLASLAKSNRRRGEGELDTSGFVTLEALMLSRQEEERRAHAMFQAHALESAAAVPQFRAPPPPMQRPLDTMRSNQGRQNGIDIGRSMQGNIQARSTQRSGQQSSAPGPATQPRPSHSRSTSGFGGDERDLQTATLVRRSSFNNPSSRLNRNTDLDSRDYRDGSPEKLWIDSLRRTDTTDNRRYPPTPRHVHSVQDWRSKKLKKAALYQPPPVSPLDNPGVSDESRMRLAFEMTLDQSLNDSQSKRCYTKSGPTPAARLRNLFTSKNETHPAQKSLLGSPRLHRAFFRGSVSRADSGGESLNSPPLSPPQDLDLPLINLRSVPISNPPTPDYPGLEYPPVFEPGTYSLSDASTLLRHRNREDR